MRNASKKKAKPFFSFMKLIQKFPEIFESKERKQFKRWKRFLAN